MFFTFWTPPGALRGPNPFSRDPPGSSRSAPWSSRGGPKSCQEGPGASKGQIKFTKSACSNPRKYSYLASRDLKKTLSDHFSKLRVPPRDPPVWRPYSSRSAPGSKKRSPELPGTPQEPLRPPPGPPRAPLKCLSWHHFFLKSWMFSFSTLSLVILTIFQSVSLFVNVPLSAFTHISTDF